MNFEDLHFWVRCLRYRFRTERLQLKTLLSLNLCGGTALDIGANKGIYSYWLARAVGPAGKVVAFEPQPEMARYIDRRKHSFRLKNVKVLNTALSKESGTATLTRRGVGDGSASLEPTRLQAEQIEVKITSLDSMHIPDLKFIKCDVEGHELDVFSGAERTIGTYRPVVQFEAVPAEATKLFSYFTNLGYSGVMFLGNHYLPFSNPDRVEHYKFGLNGHRDFLFFPPEAIGTTIPTAVSRHFPI
ncbi:FkbM family methyltransferase [Bradyrhizobium diazoefficiens]|uniref:FkbM family methyltransferase n=1 Tax=Bradyrhizobium diazoefficiens TaxID=1355477 RepID=UPI001B73108E|nr:FkbM family methyltransferase [Bradyrhizobium japonicum]